MKNKLFHFHIISIRNTVGDIGDFAIEHCRMVAFLDAQSHNLTWGQYVSKAGALGINHVSKDIFDEYIGQTH